MKSNEKRDDRHDCESGRMRKWRLLKNLINERASEIAPYFVINDEADWEIL